MTLLKALLVTLPLVIATVLLTMPSGVWFGSPL